MTAGFILSPRKFAETDILFRVLLFWLDKNYTDSICLSLIWPKSNTSWNLHFTCFSTDKKEISAKTFETPPNTWFSTAPLCNLGPNILFGLDYHLAVLELHAWLFYLITKFYQWPLTLHSFRVNSTQLHSQTIRFFFRNCDWSKLYSKT